MSPKDKRDIIWNDNIHLLLNAHIKEEDDDGHGNGVEKFKKFKIHKA